MSNKRKRKRKEWFSEYDKYLESDWWRARREEALEKAGRRCSKCGSTKRLHVHHLTYARIGAELDEDLEVLCKKCHGEQHDHPIGIPGKARRRKKRKKALKQARPRLPPYVPPPRNMERSVAILPAPRSE